MSRILPLLLSILVFLLSGCNYSGKLTKRYYNNKLTPEDVGTNITKYVDVNAYVIDKEATTPTPPKTIFDLTEKGQKELIKQAGIKEPANDKFILSLTSPLSSKPGSEIEFIDYTKAERRIVVTLKNLSHMPADRIGKITVTLDIDPEFKILSCNKLTTEYQTLDLGKLNYSNSNQVELSGNLSDGLTGSVNTTNLVENTGSNTIDENSATGSKNSRTNTINGSSTSSRGIAGKFNASRSFSEEVLLKQRIVTLSASISNNTLTLFQESISGIDLSGNILADILFESKADTRVERVYSFTGLSSAAGFAAPGTVKVKEKLISFFNFTKDINAKISYEADFRQVEKRHRTITESDDQIKILYGKPSTSKNITLLSKDQLKPKLWILYLNSDAAKMPLQILSPAAGARGELIFNSYTEARDFVTWLKNQAATVVTASGAIGSLGHILYKPNGTALDATSISNIQIGISQ